MNPVSIVRFERVGDVVVLYLVLENGATVRMESSVEQAVACAESIAAIVTDGRKG